MIIAHSERWDFCKHHPDGISADEGCQKCADERADERSSAVTVVSSDEDGVVTFDAITPEAARIIPVPPDHLKEDESLAHAKPQCAEGVCEFCDAIRRQMTPEDIAWRNYRAGKGML